MILFIIVELFLAREPVLAPFLLKQRIPVLVGMSNFLVAICNFAIQYYFPMWFQAVMLTSASTAGEIFSYRVINRWPTVFRSTYSSE